MFNYFLRVKMNFIYVSAHVSFNIAIFIIEFKIIIVFYRICFIVFYTFVISF